MVGLPRLAELLRLWDERGEAIPLAELKRGLSGLDLSAEDLGAAVGFDDRSYRRATIHATPHYEMLVLCWKSGQASPIHDHSGSACAVLVVEGRATETRYRRTPCGHLAPTRATTMAPGSVTCCRGDCTHQMANLERAGDDLVTLHVYSPPPAGWRFHTLDQTILSDNDRLIRDRPSTVRVDLGHPPVSRPLGRQRRTSWKA